MGAVLARFSESSAGHTCAVMSFALGFQAAGWEVFLVEALNKKDLTFSEGCSISDQERFWKSTAEEFGFSERQCLLIDGESSSFNALQEFAEGADLFLNYSGQFHRLDLLPPALKKAYLDVDPAFTQIWAEGYSCDMNFSGHDTFLTVGLAMGRQSQKLPTAGLDWKPVLPPLPAKIWRERSQMKSPKVNAQDAWTTVAHWYGYGDIEWEGTAYCGKRQNLLQMMKLPSLAPGRKFAIATDLQKHWGDYEEFVSAGWNLIPSSLVCGDVASYLGYIATSRGELGIVKQGYSKSGCGWISDRSLIYLALGKPVLLQETGWTSCLPSDYGLCAFHGAEDAAKILEKMEESYDLHAKGASELAENLFAPSVTVEAIAKACSL